MSGAPNPCYRQADFSHGLETVFVAFLARFGAKADFQRTCSKYLEPIDRNNDTSNDPVRCACACAMNRNVRKRENAAQILG